MSFVEEVLKQEHKTKVKANMPRTARRYSLYQRQGGRWVRVSMLAEKKDSAVRLFQNILLASCMHGWPELRLMPVKVDRDIPEPIGEILKG